LIFGLSDKLGISILGFPFGFGLFTAYCLCRLKFPDIEDTKNLESEMRASFNYQSHSTKRWFIWLFSILFGVINVILLGSVEDYSEETKFWSGKLPPSDDNEYYIRLSSYHKVASYKLEILVR
jgi:hypothetical protein